MKERIAGWLRLCVLCSGALSAETRGHQQQRISARAQHRLPLLDALQPVFLLFQPFLSDDDAARLLSTSHATALTLLPGYAFTSHIFRPASLASLRRLRDQCVLYRLRITQLDLSASIKQLTFDDEPPDQSPIPASVIVLSFGAWMSDDEEDKKVDEGWAALSAAASDWQQRERWRLPRPSRTGTATRGGSRRCGAMTAVRPSTCLCSRPAVMSAAVR